MKIFILIIVLLITTCLYSTVINVPADQPTIQDGIVAAAETDTVLVAEGTYFENIDFIGKAITVASNFLIDADTLHIENTIINGSQPTDPDFGSCVMFLSGEDTTSVIIGFTLTEGTGCFAQSVNGNVCGGIRCDNSSPKIISNIVTTNSALYAGGIGAGNDCSPILLNNVISYNTATGGNAGISLFNNVNAYLESNIISNNTANEHVGGIMISDSSPTLVGNVIRDNSALTNTGGIHIQSDSSPVLLNNIICNNTAETYIGGVTVLLGSETSVTTIKNCQIYGNTAGLSGGGLRVYDATVDVINCIISDNQAGTYGGGVAIYENSNINISYTTITVNSASNDGGGIEILTSTPVITNCTIYDNEAFGCGNQIDCWSGGLEAVNCIIGGNSTNESVYFGTSTAIFDYCDFYNTDGLDFDGNVPTGLGVITTVNNNEDPCDEFMNILLDPLFVDSEIPDFHLTEFSPCIDAGDPDAPLDPDGTYIEIGKYYFEQTGTENNTIVQTTNLLHQNYPNPFNPITTISYQLPENGKVELTVYNLKGQKVKTLVNETLDYGDHTVIWNGKDDNGKSVSSGIYLYKLKTDNFENTKKMILLK